MAIDGPILQTKLHVPPPRPNLVPRPYLIEKLHVAGQRRLTLLSAPAGFGKTTLLAEWIRQQENRVAWLTLDKGDNDLSRFLVHLAAALSWLDLDFAGLPVKLGQVTPAAKEAMPLLINRIAAASDHFTLILDDYHWIKAQPVHQALAFLLENQPAQMHLIIASRVDPPLPLSRLRGQGEVTELRLHDLRFSQQEAAAFLYQTTDFELSANQVAALTSRTEGWIAGLQMAAISLQGKPTDAIASFIQAFTGSNRYVMDYLMEEVLQRQTDDLQRFLLHTSILDRLTGKLCDALEQHTDPAAAGAAAQPAADIGDGQAILEYLERSNLFLIPLDDERHWYRYHHLFASLLRKRLQQTTPDRIPELHRQASNWFEQEQMMTPAIDHALAAADFERAKGLIEAHTEAALMRGEFVTFLKWVEALPEASIRESHNLTLYYQATCLMQGHPLTDIEARLQELESTRPYLSGKITAIRALIALFQGKIPQAIALSHQALPALSDDDLFLRQLVAMNLALSPLEQDDYAATMQALAEVAEAGQASNNIIVSVGAICTVARLSTTRGQLKSAAENYRRALALATEDSGQQRLPVASKALIGLGDLWREWNDLEKAKQYLNQGIELAKPLRDLEVIEGHLSLSLLYLGQSAHEQANDEIRQAKKYLAEFDATEMDDHNVSAFQARLWLVEGNHDAVGRWATRRQLSGETALAELRDADKEGYLLRLRQKRRWSEYLMLARFLNSLNKPDEALRFLEPLGQMEEQLGLYGRLIGVLILKSLALQALGQLDEAAEALQQAMSLAQPEDYVRIFVDEGPALIPLLRLLARQGFVPEYTRKLLNAFNGSEAEALSPPLLISAPAMIDPLSEREMEVLRLLDTDLSVPEMANMLFVATSTVRSHIKQIYSKLGVHRRREAIHKAESLGLLT